MDPYKSILITGGAGFIGSHFTRQTVKNHPRCLVTVLDKLTYAGNPANLESVRGRLRFVKGDIVDRGLVEKLMKGQTAVVHFAAETHVDRSLIHSGDFLRTNVLGTQVLLEAARRAKVGHFLHVSTDEVYGSRRTGFFRETDPLHPSSPYSSSKAGSDLLALSYFATYGLPVVVTRCTNNYGPFQHPEKLIPLFVTHLMQGLKVPVYGGGGNRRDWIFVEDHCRALDLALRRGRPGEIYNVAGGQEKDNLAVTRALLELLGQGPDKISFVKDRPGHDWRNAVSGAKIARLGFKPKVKFDQGLAQTVDWYRGHEGWWRAAKSGVFRDYYRLNYGRR